MLNALKTIRTIRTPKTKSGLPWSIPFGRLRVLPQESPYFRFGVIWHVLAHQPSTRIELLWVPLFTLISPMQLLGSMSLVEPKAQMESW